MNNQDKKEIRDFLKSTSKADKKIRVMDTAWNNVFSKTGDYAKADKAAKIAGEVFEISKQTT